MAAVFFLHGVFSLFFFFFVFRSFIFGKCPRTLYTKVIDKMAYTNSADLDQEQSDLGAHSLPFY